MRFALCRAVPPPRARQQHGRAPASHRLSTDPRPPAARTANSPPAASAGRVSADRRSLAVTPEIVEAPPAATAVIDRLGRCRSGLTRRLRGRGAGASDQRVSRTTLRRFVRWQFWIVRRASIRSASIRSVCPVITTGRRTVRHMSNRVGIVVGLVESRILRRRRRGAGRDKRQAATQDKNRHHAAEQRCEFQNDLSPAGRPRAVDVSRSAGDTCREQFTG